MVFNSPLQFSRSSSNQHDAERNGHEGQKQHKPAKPTRLASQPHSRRRARIGPQRIHGARADHEIVKDAENQNRNHEKKLHLEDCSKGTLPKVPARQIGLVETSIEQIKNSR